MPYHSKLTEEVVDRAISLKGEGLSDADIIAALGIHTSTFYRWQAEDDTDLKHALKEGLKKAEADYKATLLNTIRSAALAKNSNWTAAAWLLERKYPDEFGRVDRRREEPRQEAVPQIVLGVAVAPAGLAAGEGGAVPVNAVLPAAGWSPQVGGEPCGGAVGRDPGVAGAGSLVGAAGGGLPAGGDVGAAAFPEVGAAREREAAGGAGVAGAVAGVAGAAEAGGDSSANIDMDSSTNRNTVSSTNTNSDASANVDICSSVNRAVDSSTYRNAVSSANTNMDSSAKRDVNSSTNRSAVSSTDANSDSPANIDLGSPANGEGDCSEDGEADEGDGDG